MKGDTEGGKEGGIETLKEERSVQAVLPCAWGMEE